ncbi:hypothetical protein CISIN_1g0293302mg, partial [Citrus sinensis]
VSFGHPEAKVCCKSSPFSLILVDFPILILLLSKSVIYIFSSSLVIFQIVYDFDIAKTTVVL